MKLFYCYKSESKKSITEIILKLWRNRTAVTNYTENSSCVAEVDVTGKVSCLAASA